MRHRLDELALAAARLRRLEGAAGVVFAVGQAGDLLLAAEMEARASAGRRSASGSSHSVERLDVLALVCRDARAPRRAAPIGARPRRRARGAPDCPAARSGSWPRRRWRGHARPRPVALHARGGGAARKAEPVHLADHGVAGDAAESAGDLAGAQPFGPELLQQLDAFVGPCHNIAPGQSAARASCSAHQWTFGSDDDGARDEREHAIADAKGHGPEPDLDAELRGTLGTSRTYTRGGFMPLNLVRAGLLLVALSTTARATCSDEGKPTTGDLAQQERPSGGPAIERERWYIRNTQCHALPSTQAPARGCAKPRRIRASGLSSEGPSAPRRSR